MADRALIGLALPALRALVGAGALRPIPPQRLPGALRAIRAYGMGAAAGCAVSAARNPQGIAVIDERGSLTFAQLDARAARIAGGLHAVHAVGKDGTGSLGVMCRNHRGFVEAMLAASHLGVDLLLLNTDFPGPQLAQALGPHRLAAIVHDEEFAPVLDAAGYDGPRVLAWHDDLDGREGTLEALAARAAPAPPPPDSPGRLVILSSGTTGPPKGAPREPSAAAALGPLTTLLEQVGFRAGGPILIGPPVFHGFGLAFLGIGLFVGAPVVLRRRFDPAATLADVAQHRVTHLAGVPVMLQRILDLPAQERARHDTSSLRAVASAAAPLSPQLATAFMDAFGEVVFNLYGSTETGFASLATPADLRAAPGTVGRAPRGVTLKVLDGARREAPADTAGHVFLGSGLVFEGYSGGGSREIVDGMMNTGDLGHLDSAGRLFIDGREDDMIVSGGENVFPQEVADEIATHPAVADAAVFGVEDVDFGQRLRAYVVATPAAELTAEDMLAHLRTRIARYKLPRDVVFVEEIPRNPTGKVQRARLPEG